jgi:hypothetical protein
MPDETHSDVNLNSSSPDYRSSIQLKFHLRGLHLALGQQSCPLIVLARFVC